jgi:hypothetical protein
MLPFSREAFLSVFVAYNEAVWPAGLAAYALGGIALLALWRKEASARKAALLALAAMWLWTGIAYQWLFFAPVNPAAYLFGALFVAEGLMLVVCALRAPFGFAWKGGAGSWLGAGLLAYSILAYPLIGTVSGEAYPALPMFGITPCPVTLFTVGMLLLSTRRPPLVVTVIPVAWSLVALTAAFQLGILQDWALLVAGPAAAFILWPRSRPARPGIRGFTDSGPGRGRPMSEA